MSAEALVVMPDSELNEREKQQYCDLTTQFAELVDGYMRTEFELIVAGNDLTGEDGRSITETTFLGLEESRATAKIKPNLWFEVPRRENESDEVDEVIEMAQGKGSNTKVAVSDFPAALMDSKEDVGGYNVTRKQTMLRIYIRKPDGTMHMHSQSLDGSNRQALEAIYTHLRSTAEPGELLGQRIDVYLSPESQDALVDELRDVYDQSLNSQFGGQWYAGRRQADYRNTYDFVCCQHDLISECISLDSYGMLNRNIMYNMAATMNKRFRDEKQGIISIMPSVATVDTLLIHQEIEQAGAEARRLGLTFSACGDTLSTQSLLEEAGFGNKTDSETKYKFDKKMYCVVCQTKAKEGDSKKMCGPCGICRSCDRKMVGKG